MRKSSFKSIKIEERNSKIGAKRIKLFYFLLFALFGVLFARIFFLQVVQFDENSSFFLQMKSKREKILPARGNIFDRNDNILASSKASMFVDLNATLKGLYGKERTEMIKKISAMSSYSELLIYDTLSKNEKLEIPFSSRYNNNDIVISTEYKRQSSFTGSLSHIVGYLNNNLEGVSGIESFFQKELEGKQGELSIELNALGRQIDTKIIKNPFPGKDIKLSLDSEVQSFLERKLAETGKKSLAIISNPENGEIISMVSYPWFESSEMMNDLFYEKWENLLNENDEIFFNRAIQIRYQPGSLIKPFMSLYELSCDEKSLEEISQKKINCTGKYIIETQNGSKVFHDWLSYGHGETDLFQAIKKSCNIYFYTLGTEIPPENLKEFSDELLLTSKTGVEILNEPEGFFPSPAWKEKELKENWYLGDTLLTSIGQGFVSVTGIGLLKVFELIANEGIAYKSTFLQGKSSIIRNRLEMEKEKWNYLKSALNSVINEIGGTGYTAFEGSIVREVVCGKTGTSETGKEGIYNSWFAGFAPLNDPKVSIIIMIERGGYGSETAAPIAKEIFDFLFEKKYFCFEQDK